MFVLVQYCINFEVISVRCSCQYKAEEGGDAGNGMDSEHLLLNY